MFGVVFCVVDCGSVIMRNIMMFLSFTSHQMRLKKMHIHLYSNTMHLLQTQSKSALVRQTAQTPRNAVVRVAGRFAASTFTLLCHRGADSKAGHLLIAWMRVFLWFHGGDFLVVLPSFPVIVLL